MQPGSEVPPPPFPPPAEAQRAQFPLPPPPYGSQQAQRSPLPPRSPLLDAGFQRLSPLTPVVNAARVVGILVVLALIDLSGAHSGHGKNGNGNSSELIIYGGVAVVVMIAGFISWLVTRYRVEKGELRVDSGLLRRQSKRLRLDRLQSVDVVTPLVARIFSLAELRLTTGGTDNTSVKLRYLPAAEAQQLRAELLGRAAGLGPGVTEAPERPLVVVKTGTLIGSIILDLASFRAILLLIGPIVGAITAASGSRSGTAFGVGLGLFLPFLFVIGSDIWRRVNTQYQFTVAESPDGLRLRAGLLSTRAQTVPPGRIQALRIRRPFLWRPFGWAQVQMNVSGVGRQGGNRVLIPVAPLEVARQLTEKVLGEVPLDSVAVTRPPKRAAWCSPIWWRWMAAGSNEKIFLTRHGIFSPSIDVVPNARTQSVHLRAGPWQRLWGLGTLHLDTTRGPVKVRAAHRDAVEGRAMLDRQADRARLARKAAPPDRWMTHTPTVTGPVPT